MLQSLEVLNGEMTPKFDKYNNIYSVKVKDDVTSLEINYTADDNCDINVIGNSNFIAGENRVYITVVSDETRTTYTILVNKEEAETVSVMDMMESQTIEIKKELPEYVAPLISIVCFLIILITFSLLFHKKVRRKV